MHQLGQFLLGGLDLLVDGLELGDQLDGEPAPGLADDVAGLDRGDQGPGLRRGQELLRPAGKQLQQQPVQPVDGLGAGPAQLVTAVDQHAHHDQVVIDLDPDQVRWRAARPSRPSARRPGRSCGRCRWRTPAPARTASPARRARSRRRGPGGARCACRCRCSPRPPRPGRRILAAGGEHLGVAGLVGAEPAHGQHPAAFVDDLDRGRTLVRVHPDDHRHRCLLLLNRMRVSKEGTATSSRANPFRASPRAVPGEAACHERATPMTPVGSR